MARITFPVQSSYASQAKLEEHMVRIEEKLDRMLEQRR